MNSVGGAPSTGGTSGSSSGGASGGSSSDGGAAGSAIEDTGGSPGSGGAPTQQSPGCDLPTEQATATWVESPVDVDGSARPYSTWLPTDYDPGRAYPVILLLHGCGSGTNNLPMENQTGSDAVVVRGTGSGEDGCWDDAADVPFIDAMMVDVKARFCTDTSRFFAVGYSSGSWVASLLSCIRADVFRGIGTVAGGENSRPGECKGPVARMFFNDVDDLSNRIEWARPGLDRMLTTNECDDPPQSDPVTPVALREPPGLSARLSGSVV